MSTTKSQGTLGTWYESRIGEATTDDEINGYWLFFAGVLSGLLGVLVFFVTTPATSSRGIGYALLALSPVLIMLGAVIRLPLRRAATSIAGIGALICVIAIVWFLTIFPDGWSLTVGETGVILTYIIGLFILGAAGAFIPLLTDPIRGEHETLKKEAAAAAADLETRDRELDEATDRAGASEEKVAALTAEIEALRTSKARFELYEDKAGEHRWRLRHRNGNVIATSGEGYTRRHNAQNGLQSVRRNALGAGTLQIEGNKEVPKDADDPEIAVPAVAEDSTSKASFELYEDKAGEYRWNLRHNNGNIIADSGEGYASKSNLNRAVKRVREHINTAAYLDLDPVGYELYRDSANEWRWRLVHKNGNVLADSGEGYSSRAAARNGVESVRTNIADAEVEEQ